MKNNMNSSAHNASNSKGVSEKFNDPQKLTDVEKKELRVKDGQHNHHVDERGGAN
ncbi:hypothetical protein [Psychrobacillus vulpis]|uniref:hypothetical protein n=1 Tax=Psychrobacillus vulpis TaxID=2325572 RepID=UPI0014088D40|nr:hypothetical protein [Psychrobacillus vulpis]